MPNKIDAKAIGFTLTGAILGAGFASGQEIQQFFVRYGSVAFLGAGVSILVFAVFSSWLFSYCRRHHINDLRQLLSCLAGPRVGRVFWHILTLFLWFGLTVMLAGSATLIAVLFGLPRPLGAILTAVIVYLVCLRQVSGLAAANELLIPLLLFLVVFFLLRSSFIPATPSATVTGYQHAWLGSALLYIGFNSALLLAIVPPLATTAKSFRDTRRGVLLASFLLLGLLLANIFLLSKYASIGTQGDMPLFYIAQYLLPSLPWLYGVLLFIALTTTAFANALGIAQYIEETPAAPVAQLVLLIVIIAAALLAQLAFGRLVAVLYPLTGYLCLLFYATSGLRKLIGFDRH
ncbi:MAG: hypothetical protein GX060_07740 [Firmicutes bacterium]|nr:hypothetical protein [Bacillota bacterium]